MPGTVDILWISLYQHSMPTNTSIAPYSSKSSTPEKYQYTESQHGVNYHRNLDIYKGNAWKHFEISEFDYPLQAYDYVSYKEATKAIDTLVDFTNASGVEIDFGDVKTNQDWEKIRTSSNFNNINTTVLHSILNGSGYGIVSVEDNVFTAYENDSRVNFYPVDPAIVFADCDKYNPTRPAKKYTVVQKKDDKENDKQYVAYISYMPGLIEYEAYDISDEPVQVDAMQYFPELFSDSIDYGAGETDMTVIQETNTKYNVLQHFRIQVLDNFYGKGAFDDATLSLLQLVNKLGNLAKFVVTSNSTPKLQMNQATAELMTQIVNEVNTEQKSGISVESAGISTPTSYTHNAINAVRNVGFRAMSWLNSQVFWRMNKKMMYFAGGDRNDKDNMYIINNYSLQDLFTLQEKTFQHLKVALNQSLALDDPNISTGNVGSGVAYNRLFQSTISYVENVRNKYAPKIAMLAYCAMQLAFNAGLVTAEPTNLPVVTFTPIIDEGTNAQQEPDEVETTPADEETEEDENAQDLTENDE